MKLRQTLLIAALALFAASGLMAKEQAKKTEVPGVAPQPAEFFYTGKPYDADLGAYTFNYRNYDPELKRWTSMDPSGFPDGANNCLYTNQPLFVIDPDGNTTAAISLAARWSTTNADGSSTVHHCTWTGEFVYSFDNKYEKMTQHQINATGGLLGETAGFSFDSSDSSNTQRSGFWNRDEIKMYCQLVYTNANGVVTKVDQASISGICGNWYE